MGLAWIVQHCFVFWPGSRRVSQSSRLRRRPRVTPWSGREVVLACAALGRWRPESVERGGSDRHAMVPVAECMEHDVVVTLAQVQQPGLGGIAQNSGEAAGGVPRVVSVASSTADDAKEWWRCRPFCCPWQAEA